eukprot:5430235-Alexandrium_andersonii.AAC.1
MLLPSFGGSGLRSCVACGTVVVRASGACVAARADVFGPWSLLTLGSFSRLSQVISCSSILVVCSLRPVGPGTL